jgi:ABC-type phosphate transport system auxiliary subunit
MSALAVGEGLQGRRAGEVPNVLSQQRGSVRGLAPEFAAQIREMNEQFIQLTRTVGERTNQLNAQLRQIEQLEGQLTQIEAERTRTMTKLQSIENNNIALAAEAEKMKLLATGAAGFAAGLGVGVIYGVTGPNILLYGAGGSGVFLASRVCYKQFVGD